MTTNQNPNDMSTWLYTNAELQSLSLTVSGLTMAVIALGVHVRILLFPQCRRYTYIWAFVECLCCVEGLITSAYFSGTRFFNCWTKNIITTLILNLSPIFVCVSLSFVAEVAITNHIQKTQFRYLSAFLNFGQFGSLLARVFTSTLTPTNTGTCNVGTTFGVRVSPMIIHLMTVLLYTGVFLWHMQKNGLLGQSFSLKKSTTNMIQATGASAMSTSAVVQSLTLNVILMCFVVILSSIILFIALAMTEAGTPVKIDTIAFGFRTFCLSIVCYLNAQAVLKRSAPANNYSISTHKSGQIKSQNKSGQIVQSA